MGFCLTPKVLIGGLTWFIVESFQVAVDSEFPFGCNYKDERNHNLSGQNRQI